MTIKIFWGFPHKPGMQVLLQESGGGGATDLVESRIVSTFPMQHLHSSDTNPQITWQHKNLQSIYCGVRTHIFRIAKGNFLW